MKFQEKKSIVIVFHGQECYNRLELHFETTRSILIKITVI